MLFYSVKCTEKAGHSMEWSCSSEPATSWRRVSDTVLVCQLNALCQVLSDLQEHCACFKHHCFEKIRLESWKGKNQSWDACFLRQIKILSLLSLGKERPKRHVVHVCIWSRCFKGSDVLVFLFHATAKTSHCILLGKLNQTLYVPLEYFSSDQHLIMEFLRKPPCGRYC